VPVIWYSQKYLLPRLPAMYIHQHLHHPEQAVMQERRLHLLFQQYQMKRRA
jgi:hypothetical protein